MNKKPILVLIVLSLLTLALFGCTSNQQNSTVANSNSNPDLCKNLAGQEKTACYSQLGASAGSTKDLTICKNILEQDGKSTCVNAYSVYSGDASACIILSPEDVIDNCYYWFATQRFKPNVCDSILDQNTRDYCYLGVAGQPGDYPVYKMDPLYCGKISAADKSDACYSRIAWVKKDITICDNIKDASNKEICKNEVSNS